MKHTFCFFAGGAGVATLSMDWARFFFRSLNSTIDCSLGMDGEREEGKEGGREREEVGHYAHAHTHSL